MHETIELHGIPMDLGANLRGVDMGPTALRIAGLERALEAIGYTVIDRDEVSIPSRAQLPRAGGSAKYLDEIVVACERLCVVAQDAMERKVIPIFMGGDHSLAVGTISGVSSYFRERKEKLGVIWFDAHADMNTPDSSPSGNVHGMPLAALLGIGPSTLCEIGGFREKFAVENTVVVGARDVDENERKLVAKSGVKVFSMKEIDQLGMAEVTRRSLEIAGKGTSRIHLSFDIDGLDPSVAPGVGTPVRGGINFREAHLFMELLADSGKICSLDVVELNPVRDDKNCTAEAVIHLLQSLFGRSIL
ncbi:MAG: arginase [Planctomycetota bacterium]